MKLNAVAKLPESDFEVDPGLREMIEAQIKEEEETVRQVGQLSTPRVPSTLSYPSISSLIIAYCNARYVNLHERHLMLVVHVL